MTSHQLAKELLVGPDLPVIINGWSSDEGIAWEVKEWREEDRTFESTEEGPRDRLGYRLKRPCITLDH
jgi:hypothetical protein